MTRILVTIFAAIFGMAFGSFLNVCLSRWPEGESIVAPRSHCRHCARQLHWWENIPLVSWIALGGRCRGCGVWIGFRYLLVESVVGVLWALVAWQSFQAFFPVEFALGMMTLMWMLVGLAVLDAEHLWLPDAITLPGIALGLGWWLFQQTHIGWTLRIPSELGTDLRQVGARLLGVLAAAGLILLIRWTYWLIRRREGIGLGDAKLMALLAAWLGLPGALLSFATGVILGALAALVVLLAPSRPDAQPRSLLKLPLGTFLSVGGIVSALWGQQIVTVYLRWAGL